MGYNKPPVMDNLVTEKEYVNVRSPRSPSRCPGSAQFVFYPVAFQKKFPGATREPSPDEEIDKPSLLSGHSNGLRRHQLRTRHWPVQHTTAFLSHFFYEASPIPQVASKTQEHDWHLYENRFSRKEGATYIITTGRP